MKSSPPSGPPTPNPRLRLLPYLFAAGAIFWLVELTQSAARAAAPVWRDQVQQALVHAGITRNVTTVLVVYLAVILLFQATAAALHGAAYYGLKRLRAWGWVVAVIVAGAWSLILVGIPVLVLLFRRQTREAYGIS